MTDAPPTKAELLSVMDAVWNELDALLGQFEGKLDQRMPIDAPSWTGRQLLGHMLGSLQSNAYYLAQPRDGAPIEVVLGDPYWRQINQTATVASFRTMMFAAHIGTVLLIESMEESVLRKTAPSGGREVSALGLVHFNYHVHLRSHVEDLRAWVAS